MARPRENAPRLLLTLVNPSATFLNKNQTMSGKNKHKPTGRRLPPILLFRIRGNRSLLFRNHGKKSAKMNEQGEGKDRLILM
jgi:hypothetical protein